VTAETAWRTMAQRDPWTNLLRGSIAAFAAGVGGADAIAVLPFTAALGPPDPFARRIARNIQLLLLEESNIWRVSDPAAGAGGIEDLTSKLAQAAWALFQKVEQAGGAPAALEAGLIQDKVAGVRAEREKAVALRREVLTGTSDYPLLSEAKVEVLDVKPVTPAAYPVNIEYAPLPAIRLAEPFEKLRDASDSALAKTGSRPKVFLANLGAPTEFNARATFAKNFFEAGGIEAITNDGFAHDAEMVNAFRDSDASIACLCSSDDIYMARATSAARALKSAGAAHVYLAGRPKDADALKAAGVGSFIFAGCDALAVLQAAHKLTGSL
jgi:methylmalonyl-CoA mutase